MGPKNKSKSSFALFMDDYIEQQRSLGRKISLKVAAEECGVLWKGLPEDEKHKYGKLSATFKQYTDVDKKKKYTSIGKTYAELENEMKQLQLSVQMAEDEMKDTISKLNQETLKTQLFYIIHCNYYCKTDEGLYVPGELAISEFNLQDGIRNTFHTLINPGQIPLGWAYEAKKTIEEIHDLPYPPFEAGDSDYLGILNKILMFLEPGKLPNDEYSPLYCLEKNLKACESILKTLSENQSDMINYFRVYPIHKMFFLLKNKCVEHFDDKNLGFPVISTAEYEVNKDIFAYVPGISCDFHAMSKEKYNSCSLSVVQRYIYLICDHCCQHVGVKLIPNKHCRDKCNVKGSSAAAKVEQKNSCSNYLYEDDDFDGKSSYSSGSSTFTWEERKTGSFLHDELGSKYQDRKLSSVSVISSGKLADADDSSDEDEWPQLKPLGRGAGRRK